MHHWLVLLYLFTELFYLTSTWAKTSTQLIRTSIRTPSLNPKLYVMYTEDGGKRRHALVEYEDRGDGFVQTDRCFLIQASGVVSEFINTDESPLHVWLVKKLSPDGMNEMVKNCVNVTHSAAATPVAKLRDPADSSLQAEATFKEFRFLLIAPGTKWCGPGDIAKKYDDLGESKETDMCCRDHDHCNDTIKPLKSKYGLRNTMGFTVSHCDCDDLLHQCLSNAPESTAKLVGTIYFNVFQTKCFKEEHPIIECIGRTRQAFGGPCQEYKLDTSKPKKWQFFDPKLFTRRARNLDFVDETATPVG